MTRYEAARTPEEKKTLASLVRTKQGYAVSFSRRFPEWLSADLDERLTLSSIGREVEAAAAGAKRTTPSPPPMFSAPPPQARPIKRYPHYRHTGRFDGGPSGCLGIASPTMYIIEISDDEDEEE